MSDIRKLNSELKLENKKQCSDCITIKDLSEFSLKSGYYRNICNKCKYKYEIKRRKEINNSLKKDLFCSKCGYNKCPDAIEFHHTDPTKKDGSISDLISRGGSLEKIKRELQKDIIILCANCHREEHYRLKQNEVE